MTHTLARGQAPLRPPARARASRTLTAIAASVALVLAPVLATPAAAVDEAVDPTAVVAPATASLAGSLTVGSTVSVEHGAWTPADATLSYVWWQSPEAYQAPVDGIDQNDDAVVIDGATTAELDLDSALAGRFVWAVVTGSAPELTSASVIAASAGPVALPSIPSVPDVTITGTAVVGAPLAAVLSAPLPEGVAVAYQWQRTGAPIDGEVGESYTAVADDALATLAVVATFTADGFSPTTRTSTGVVVAKATFLGAPAATMSGVVRVESPVTAVTGAWPEGTTFAFSWRFVDSKGVETVSRSTSQVYAPTASTLGRKLSVVITGTVPGHLPVSKRSAATTIAPGVFTSAPTPTIAGSAYVGATLKATTGTWAPTATLRYQWKRDGVSISGATASSYRLTSYDYGKKITVTVGATRTGYTKAVRTSAPTATVRKPFTTTTAPKISGTAKMGFVLTAVPGTWSPTPTYTYQWKRNGVAVSGATGKTYALKSTDVGSTITVTVTYKRSGYFTRVVTSAATATVKVPITTRDGWFTVGVDIPAGTYYSDGGNSCYFERRTNKYLGQGSGLLGYQIWWDGDFGGRKVVTISASDKYFYTESCGSWQPVMPDLRTTVGDGTWVVGKHIATGTWEAVGPFDDDGCYVAGLASFTGRPDTDITAEFMIPNVGDVVYIDSTDKGFVTDGCGTWTRIGD
jgi:hypothetical protein